MKQSESGFALIELLVVIALSAIIATGAGVTTVQIIQVAQQNEDHSIAVRQAQNLGYWLSQDLMKASTVTTIDDPDTVPVEFAIINWKDWQTGNINSTSYYWSEPDVLLRGVVRENTVCDSNGVEISSTKTVVAGNIYPASLSLQEDARWTLSIESRSGNRSETRGYEIGKRK
jgi:prepilin-type N-terminal cleavage/methylation domain-containing protein